MPYIGLRILMHTLVCLDNADDITWPVAVWQHLGQRSVNAFMLSDFSAIFPNGGLP